MSYYFFNSPELLQKAKDRYHNCGGKKRQIISIKIFQQKKKKQK